PPYRLLLIRERREDSTAGLQTVGRAAAGRGSTAPPGTGLPPSWCRRVGAVALHRAAARPGGRACPGATARVVGEAPPRRAHSATARASWYCRFLPRATTKPAAPTMKQSPAISGVAPAAAAASAGGAPSEGERKAPTINADLWYACAGPLVSLPPVGSLVVYFPQGHIEQDAAASDGGGEEREEDAPASDGGGEEREDVAAASDGGSEECGRGGERERGRNTLPWKNKNTMEIRDNVRRHTTLEANRTVGS
ncbi:unnamed protein product, partial [Urochloa humidicola]